MRSFDEKEVFLLQKIALPAFFALPVTLPNTFPNKEKM